MSSSTISDDGKLKIESDSSKEDQTQPIKQSSRMVFSKAIEAITPTGPCRGFIKGVLTSDANTTAPTPIFGVYCIKWRRTGCKDENESKFVVSGLDIDEPPLNIYCSIEGKMFVKVPMTLKVVLKNPTAKVVHLISTLSVSNSDNYMCSGHKQFDISIFAYSEKELVFNLYPLKVGWQNLFELNLEYNILTDPSRDESQNQLLIHLVQRSMPKKVFVLLPEQYRALNTTPQRKHKNKHKKHKHKDGAVPPENSLMDSAGLETYEKKHKKQKRHEDDTERKKRKKEKKRKKQRHSPEPPNGNNGGVLMTNQTPLF